MEKQKEVKKMKKKALIGGVTLTSALLIYSCGGTSSSPQNVDLYLTDAPATDFPSIIVNVKEISLCNTGTGTCHSLYKSSTGINVDLTQLDGVMHYVGSATVPSGSYNRLQVRLSQSATVVDNNGNQNEAILDPQSINKHKHNTIQCDQSTQECMISFNGAVNPFAMGKLIVDFVLKDMEIDISQTPWRIVKLTMKPMTPKSKDEMMGVHYEFYGTIIDIDSTNNSVTASWKNTNYSVALTHKTVCEVNDVNYIGASNCIAQLQTNYCAEFKVKEDPANNTNLTAIKIELKGQGQCEGEGDEENGSSNAREMVGTVQSIDTNNNTFTIDSYTNPISVTSSTVCEHYTQLDQYYYGTDCLTNLQVGWRVEVKINASDEAISIERKVETYSD